MANRRDRKAADVTENAENNDAPTTIEGEQTLDGMPEAPEAASEAGDSKTPRPQIPKELRALSNEVARLSGFLGLARRAVYDNDPERAVKALTLLERSVPGAREVAELSVP